MSVTLALPPGTRAADVSVSAAGGRLAVGLRWYGSVYEGALHRPVKISETHWCLDSGEVRRGRRVCVWVDGCVCVGGVL